MTIQRIYPESKTGLIHWIEENFHEIDEFIVIFHLKDKTTMMVYDVHSYLNSLGLTSLQMDTLQRLQLDGKLIIKED